MTVILVLCKENVILVLHSPEDFFGNSKCGTSKWCPEGKFKEILLGCAAKL